MYFMANVFDAGLLLEVDQAFQQNDNIVVFMGGRHGEKFDEYLKSHSFINLEKFPITSTTRNHFLMTHYSLSPNNKKMFRSNQ